MRNFYPPVAFLVIVMIGCTNLDDAELTKRNSFIRFYEGGNSYIASDVVLTEDGGYVVGGTIDIGGNSPERKMLIFKTNKFGEKQWERIISGGSVKRLTVNPQGNVVVVGDSVKFNPTSDQIPELENYSSRLVVINLGDGAIENDRFYKVKTPNFHVDYHAAGITIDANQTHYYTLGTYKVPGSPEFAILCKIRIADLDTVWTESFDYLNRDYSNTSSIFYSNSKIFWGASIKETVGAFTKSYLTIPVIEEGSTFANNNSYGANEQQIFMRLSDMRRRAGGFVGIGTRSDPDGANSNLFFIKIDETGKFLTETLRYFDGGTSGYAVSNDTPGESFAQDTGDAIISCRDGGYVLGGSTINAETGDKDIWLMKLSGIGDVVWSRNLGGKSNESVNSIQETENGSLVLCGTIQDGNSENSVSSIVLIKTDSNGNLID